MAGSPRDPIYRRRQSDQLIEWRFSEVKEDVQELKEKKASAESVVNLQNAVMDLRNEVQGLRRVLIATALTWAIGTGGFLLAVLQLTASSR
jgi:1,4-dihydroxy-2-naphthoyl-CoA synthase